jgi:hypothetical protein
MLYRVHFAMSGIRNENFTAVENVTVAAMTLLTAKECVCHKWPRIYSVWRNHIPVMSSLMTYDCVIHRVT